MSNNEVVLGCSAKASRASPTGEKDVFLWEVAFSLEVCVPGMLLLVKD